MSSRERVPRASSSCARYGNPRARRYAHVDTSVKRAPPKVGPAAPAIETVRSVGYRFLDENPGYATTRYARTATAPMPSARSSARGVSPAGEAS
jgi:hypothetical protein